MPQPVSILHLHSSFSLGGKEARAVRLMNLMGKAARHTIVSGVADQLGAEKAIAKGVDYEIAVNPPPLTGKPSVARYEALAKYMRRFDLVLTYNWGAIDGVMSRRVFGKGAPPLVHHEDGFNADEAGGLKRERNLYRRIALPAANALVVPSQVLEEIALGTWKQPRARVHRIVNGIPTMQYAEAADARAIPGFKRKPGDVVVGTIAGMREVKDLPSLVNAVAGLPDRVKLVIVGEGPDRDRIEDAVERMGLEDRVFLPGFLPEPHRYVGLFDILALSSRSEQFPIAIVEGMAAGLPIVAPRVGDIARMVSEVNEPYLPPHQGVVWLRDALQPFVADEGLRRTVGAMNQVKARMQFDEGQMVARYRALYEGVMARPGALA
ncbi:glycosyltransferase [Sphingomonas aracearum]|uniref:Glycosyltransferase family 1 protein n=1 Tax=Sphingomonas aracearum TaxID=2283317 RepID=A0A369VWN8_9SPHN|nr:glycosyltransferase [Sphingomonas aracearum]RDE06543.1 glycosyltransferase family 1 protein [Sphingomonas aracearum]